MTGFQADSDSFSCISLDGIFYRNGECSKITGDYREGYNINKAVPAVQFENLGWTELYPTLEIKNNQYKAIAGGSSWGGAGFIAVIDISIDEIIWLIYLSSINNPTKLKFYNQMLIVTTDQNHPSYLNLSIPIDTPESFIISFNA